MAVLLGVAALVVLAVAGVLPGTGPSPAGQEPPRTSSPASTSSGPKFPLTVVALGDSVPSATTCDCAGFVERVGARLTALTGRPWVVRNHANGGWTTADVEEDLRAPSTRDDLSRADLVLVEVGANDFDLDRVGDPNCLPSSTSDCWSAPLHRLRDGLTRIINGIKRIDPRPDLRIAVLGYWNVSLDGAVGKALGEDFVLGSDALTRLVNTTVATVASSTDALYVDAYTPLKGADGSRDPTRDLLDDGDHPNARGHTLLTTAVLESLEDAGAVAAWKRE